MTNVGTNEQLRSTQCVMSELGVGGRIRRVLVDGVGKLLALMLLLYAFICSLDLLSSAFRLIGSRTAGQCNTSNTAPAPRYRIGQHVR